MKNFRPPNHLFYWALAIYNQVGSMLRSAVEKKGKFCLAEGRHFPPGDRMRGVYFTLYNLQLGMEGTGRFDRLKNGDQIPGGHANGIQGGYHFTDTHALGDN